MMTGQQSSRRAFERALWDARTGRRESTPQPSRLTLYERLMQVSIRNTYYNKSESECPDFVVHPTLATSALMRSLGILFKDEGAGFSVLYDKERQDNLLNYLRMQAESGVANGRGNGVWTRLSFLLSLKNKYFANFTQIPIGTNPTTQNFYFTNQKAHRTDGGDRVILNTGKRVSGRELVSVTSVQHPVPVGEEVESVRVYSISGVEVICVPRCVPVDIARVKDPTKINCGDFKSANPHQVCTDVIYLDFSLLPEDKYTIGKVGYDGQPVGDIEEILYTASYPTPLCYINLLFTDPHTLKAAESPTEVQGIYPVKDLWSSNATVESVDYHLDFGRRRTIWSYYIVPQPDVERFERLKIVDVTPRKPEKPLQPKIRFAGPCCVRIANGSTAYRFISTQVIPLEQQSRFRFQLRGYRLGMAAPDGVLVDRLPVASNDQVLPQSTEAVCEELEKSLCPGTKSDRPCKRLMKYVCSDGSLKQTYSEIYVYV